MTYIGALPVDRTDCTQVHATAAEIAAFLGVSASRVRHVIADHQVQACGTRWKAKLYHAPEVIRHAGAHDRQRR